MFLSHRLTRTVRCCCLSANALLWEIVKHFSCHVTCYYWDVIIILTEIISCCSLLVANEWIMILLYVVTSSSAIAEKLARRSSMTNSEILKQSRDHNHAPFCEWCHPVATVDIAYMCTKLTTRFSRSSDMIAAPKIFNGSHDLTTPLWGTVCRP